MRYVTTTFSSFRIPTIFILFFFSTQLFSQSKSFEFYYNSGKKIPNNLQVFKDSLKKWSNDHFVQITSIQGYADSIGSEKMNLRLSKKRAMKVDTIFRVLNLDLQQVQVNGNGEKFPAYSNSTKGGRSKNRRVKITLLLKPKQEASPVLPIKKDTLPIVKKECEERDTIIILPEGTEIEIKGCSLDGLRIKDIKVEAEEIFTPDKMILNDFYTQTSDGQCLSTGGMLRFKITDGSGNLVKLKPIADITLRIPKTSSDTAYNLYEMGQDKKGENTGWDKRNEEVKYLKEKEKFEVKMNSTVAAINLDYLPKPFAGLVKRRSILKTRVVRKGKSYVNGGNSVIKLNRFRPKKFDFNGCDCIAADQQYVTVVAARKGKIYYCHKKMTELKSVYFYKRKIIVRKRDYMKFDTKEQLQQQVKKDLLGK